MYLNRFGPRPEYKFFSKDRGQLFGFSSEVQIEKRLVQETKTSIRKRYYILEESSSAVEMRCYCEFACEEVDELKAHIIKVHGARDGDWRTWVAG